MFARLWRWIVNRLVRDVPVDIQRCEFDCPKLECRQGEWAKCENRLRAMDQAQKERVG